jgi:hypothetical protein
VLFVIGAIWARTAVALADRAGDGFNAHFSLTGFGDLLRGVLLVALVMFGFAALRWISTRRGNVRETNQLPARATVGREFRVGLALGWGMLLAVLLVLMLLRDLHPLFNWSLTNAGYTLLGVATLCLTSLALELVFRGFLYRQLIEAIGNTAATLVLALFYALAVIPALNPGWPRAFVVEFALALIFALCYQRTHALWLGWGLHFAWAGLAGGIFGLPVHGLDPGWRLVLTDTTGADAPTGGGFGLEASLVTLAVCIAVVPLLYRVTRDFAWEYTHAPIVAGGYPVEAQPPAAHVAMQNSAIPPAPPPLVQILGSTSTSASTLPVIDDHLRKNAPGDDAGV